MKSNLARVYIGKGGMMANGTYIIFNFLIGEIYELTLSRQQVEYDEFGSLQVYRIDRACAQTLSNLN